MALVTRCSNATCLTLFRVTPAQLQAFGGQVRCGTCGAVFDAFPSLATVADASLKVPAPAPAPESSGPETSAGPDLPSRVAEAPAGRVTEPLTRPVSEGETGAPGSAEPAEEADAVRIDPPHAAPDGASMPAEVTDLSTLQAETCADLSAPVVDEVLAPAQDAPAQDAPAQHPPTEDTPDLRASAARPALAPLSGPEAADDVPSNAPTLPRGAGSSEPWPAPEPEPSAAPELTDYSVTRGPPLKPESAGLRSKWTGPRPVAGLAVLVVIGAAAALWFGRSRLPPPAAALLEQVARSLTSMHPAELIGQYGAPIGAVLALMLFYVLRRFPATWVFASCALLLLLSGQVLHAYRTPLAANYPGMRPALEKFCAVARCEVGLPRAAGELVIEASDLQALDVAKPNLIQLSATVRNRAATALAYPAIEVTLTDPQDKPLARRVLLPDQYLARRPDDRIGLRAGDEFSVKLTLDTTELRPVGYRLYLFYP